MQRRINAGSDRYFQHAELTRGESELDEVLGGRALEDDDDDEHRSDAELLAKEYSSTRARAAWAAVLVPVLTVYLIGFWGLGPLREMQLRVGARRMSLLVSGGLACAAGATALVRLGIRAIRLRRELTALRRRGELPRDPVD